MAGLDPHVLETKDHEFLLWLIEKLDRLQFEVSAPEIIECHPCPLSNWHLNQSIRFTRKVSHDRTVIFSELLSPSQDQMEWMP